MRTNIVVEGIADAVFITQFLKSLGYSVNMPPKKKKFKREGEFPISNTIWLQIINGYGNIKKQKNRFSDYPEWNWIFIIDADQTGKNEGGYTERFQWVVDNLPDSFKNKPIFIIPNNKDDGKIETILLKIASNKKTDFDECFENYIQSVKNKGFEFYQDIDEDKTRVYSYTLVNQGVEKAKEENREYSSPFWDLEAAYLKPLKEFLLKFVPSE